MLSSSPRRFRVALSFAGEKRAYVAHVADLLAQKFGKDAILYDKYHEAEFARYDLGIRLPILYGEESDLIVPILCSNYDHKRWTGWEWMQIYGLLTTADGHRVMPCRFDHATARGLSPATGYIELDHKTPEETATLILTRLALNEGQPPDYYLPIAPPASPTTAPPATAASSASVPTTSYHSAVIVCSTEDEEFSNQLYAKLKDNNVSVWYAPEDLRGGEKLHVQLEQAIQTHDRMLIVLSRDSINSEWVKTEIRRAHRHATRQKRAVLFPVTLIPYDELSEWEFFEGGTDLAQELREHYIPDFSKWRNHIAFEHEFQRLLRALKTT